MQLSAGEKLGPYEILAPLGKGGMGEVYRARDAKLNRDVAIKVLPPELAADADYRTRFDQEAQVLASLNHPNIAAIYGLEGNAIVMELVEGETLRTPLPVAEALPIARQIVEALEAAHERGIIHRDLKPGNVKVTPEGVVKVLDFGLAKSVEKGPQASVITQSADSPTVRATQAGLILGTAGYMSPEQAAGKPVDRRADIWAFGVVLYELLVGERLFDGETISHTLADVLRKEIDFERLPAEIPPSIRELLRRCLDRNLKNRLSHITEARIAIDGAEARQPVAPRPSATPWPWALALAVATIALTAVSVRHFTEKPPEQPVRSFSLAPKGLPALSTSRRAAISPDGQHIAYVSENKLWVRSLASEPARPLEGTEFAEGPFWAPDSSQIGFASKGDLKKVLRGGGAPFVLAKLDGAFRGGVWSPDGRTILASVVSQGLVELPGGGGRPKVVAPLGGQAYYSPVFLPIGGRRLVVASTGNRGFQDLDLVDLDSGKTERLSPGAYPAWSPAGYLLYQTGAQTPGLWAVKISTSTGKMEGEPVLVLNDGSDATASADGTLVWVDALPIRRRLVWRDRTGKMLGNPDLPWENHLASPSISPDGRQVLYHSGPPGSRDIWVAGLEDGIRSRLTLTPGTVGDPIWSPTGQEIAFGGEIDGKRQIAVQATTGGAEPRSALVCPAPCFVPSWSPDGTLSFTQRGAKADVDIWMAKRNADGTFAPPTVWLQTPFNDSGAVFSPDGRLVAYQSSLSGQDEVYIRPASGGGRWQVSVNGGFTPRWRRDGREVFYQRQGALLAVPIDATGGTVRSGAPVELFRSDALDGLARVLDVHPDGKRFLIAEPDEPEGAPRSIHVIQNWPALLKEKTAP